MATHQHHGADRVYRGSTLRQTASMNITPMIDVLLVLLVIFMAALPLSQRTLFIIGAGTLRYGEIITVRGAAKGAGVDKVGIVTEGVRRAAGAL